MTHLAVAFIGDDHPAIGEQTHQQQGQHGKPECNHTFWLKKDFISFHLFLAGGAGVSKFPLRTGWN